MTIKRKIAIGSIGALLTLVAGWFLLGHGTPKGQAALLTLSGENFGEFEARFNAAEGQERMVALLSPT